MFLCYTSKGAVAMYLRQVADCRKAKDYRTGREIVKEARVLLNRIKMNSK